MRVVAVENTSENLKKLIDCVHSLIPTALVKGFTNGEEAEIWCEEHSDEISIYFGNWWGIDEEFETPEGSAVWHYVNWRKKPKIICVGDEECFRKWTMNDGGDGYILRPVTIESLRNQLEMIDI